MMDIRTKCIDPSRLWRFFYCLLAMLMPMAGARQVQAVNTTTVQDVVYRAELKAHMRWLIGNGNRGRLQELETRVEHHEALLQRSAGIAITAGILLTLIHIAIDYLRLHYTR